MPNHEKDPTWGYTVDAREVFGDNYAGRRLISRDSQIDGGVYYGTYGGEAIVVDTKKYPKEYDRLLDIAKKKASMVEQRGRFGRKRTVEGDIQRGKVLGAVFDTVKEAMPYSQKGVDQTLAGLEGYKAGNKVDLSAFIQDGVGVCRHQALLTGVLLERMKEEGHIRGNISIDRNINWSPDGDPEGHAWVRYTSYDGDVAILDVAQNFNGLLDETVGRKDMWNYLRPEEQQAIAGRDIGQIALPPEVGANV